MKGKKTGGRVKGTPNKTSEEIRQSLVKLLSNNLEQLQKDLETLKPKERATILISLAKHVTAPAINPERLTEEQLIQIIKYLKENEQIAS